MEDEDNNKEPDENRYINKDEAQPDNKWHLQEFACPSCGSYNTAQATYVDYCNSCGWSQGY